MTPAEFRATLRFLGLTQLALAERLGLDASTVNRWAKGKADVPQYAVAYLELYESLKDIERHFLFAMDRERNLRQMIAAIDKR